MAAYSANSAPFVVDSFWFKVRKVVRVRPMQRFIHVAVIYVTNMPLVFHFVVRSPPSGAVFGIPAFPRFHRDLSAAYVDVQIFEFWGTCRG